MPSVQGAGQGRDAGDSRHAERDAGEEDAEALEAAAQFAEGEAQQERYPGGEAGRFGGVAGRVPCMIYFLTPRPRPRRLPRPERRRTMRSQKAGEVEIVGHEHQGRAPVALEGKEQVDDGPAGVLVEVAGGLVRHEDGGLGTMARAIATRCCSPPESCAG